MYQIEFLPDWVDLQRSPGPRLDPVDWFKGGYFYGREGKGKREGTGKVGGFCSSKKFLRICPELQTNPLTPNLLVAVTK